MHKLKTELIDSFYRLNAAASSSYTMSKKIMDGRFKRFLSSLNAVVHTPQELYTHHYVCIEVLPYDSLQQVLLHTSQY